MGLAFPGRTARITFSARSASGCRADVDARGAPRAPDSGATLCAPSEGGPVTRCTCMYRPSAGSRRAHDPVLLVVVLRDPLCPAAQIHARCDTPRDTPRDLPAPMAP